MGPLPQGFPGPLSVSKGSEALAHCRPPSPGGPRTWEKVCDWICSNSSRRLCLERLEWKRDMVVTLLHSARTLLRAVMTSDRVSRDTKVKSAFCSRKGYLGTLTSPAGGVAGGTRANVRPDLDGPGIRANLPGNDGETIPASSPEETPMSLKTLLPHHLTWVTPRSCSEVPILGWVNQFPPGDSGSQAPSRWVRTVGFLPTLARSPCTQPLGPSVYPVISAPEFSEALSSTTTWSLTLNPSSPSRWENKGMRSGDRKVPEGGVGRLWPRVAVGPTLPNHAHLAWAHSPPPSQAESRRRTSPAWRRRFCQS